MIYAWIELKKVVIVRKVCSSRFKLCKSIIYIFEEVSFFTHTLEVRFIIWVHLSTFYNSRCLYFLNLKLKLCYSAQRSLHVWEVTGLIPAVFMYEILLLPLDSVRNKMEKINLGSAPMGKHAWIVTEWAQNQIKNNRPLALFILKEDIFWSTS